MILRSCFFSATVRHSDPPPLSPPNIESYRMGNWADFSVQDYQTVRRDGLISRERKKAGHLSLPTSSCQLLLRDTLVLGLLQESERVGESNNTSVRYIHKHRPPANTNNSQHNTTTTMALSTDFATQHLLLAGRCRFPAVAGCEEVLTPELCAVVAELTDRFAPRIAWARETRLARVKAAAGALDTPLHFLQLTQRRCRARCCCCSGV